MICYDGRQSWELNTFLVFKCAKKYLNTAFKCVKIIVFINTLIHKQIYLNKHVNTIMFKYCPTRVVEHVRECYDSYKFNKLPRYHL